MYIKRVCYPVYTLGPGRRMGIWVTGCEKRCPGCMSVELQELQSGRSCTIEELKDVVASIAGTIDGVTISGGEPFLQARELHQLVVWLQETYTQDILVYSGYTLAQLRAQNNPHIQGVLQTIAVLIDGPYQEQDNDSQGIRGSSNQTIHVFKQVADYGHLATQQRELQSFRYDNQILLIGVQ